MKRGYIKLLAALGATVLIVMSLQTALAAEKTLGAGETWEVTETTAMFGLAISEGADIRAPEGRTVTMTVDGVGTAIAPGHYRGDVVLTVNQEIKIGSASPGGGMPDGGSGGPPGSGEMPILPGGESMLQDGSNPFRAAVYVENGKYVPEKSVAAMVTRGSVTDTTATDIKIYANEGNFNGIIVTGEEKSTYSVVNPMIFLNGNGGNDASGQGHGIMASGNTEVFIENAKIYNTGASRSAIFVSGNGIVHVNNSEIEVHNGPADTDGSVFSAGGVMAAGPWLLGITGNVRATNVVESGTAYYTNTHIKSQAWGALSTDGPVKVRLTAKDCLIETVESGYGAYSIGDCINTYSGCTFNVVDYGVILCDDSTNIFTDRTIVNSKRIGVMMHTGTGGGRLVIEKGSVFNTKDTVIQVKGRGTDILVDSAVLYSESGIILQSMPNDDPFFVTGMGDAMGAKGYSKDVNAVFKNTILEGDIINSYTAVSPVNVSFENATIVGAVTTGAVSQPLGPNGEKVSLDTPELYYLIGRTENTYCARFEDPYGVSVSLDENSSWVVNKTSYLTHLSIAKNRSVTTPYGHRVTMTVDGVVTHLNAGAYDGDIILTVSRL